VARQKTHRQNDNGEIVLAFGRRLFSIFLFSPHHALKKVRLPKSSGNPGKQQPENDADHAENQREFPRVFPRELDDREGDIGPCRAVRRRFVRMGR